MGNAAQVDLDDLVHGFVPVLGNFLILEPVTDAFGQPCRVIRVSDCAAVVAVVQKPRTITPRFGKPVTIQPAPKLERISPNSEIPILNR